MSTLLKSKKNATKSSKLQIAPKTEILIMNFGGIWWFSVLVANK